MEIAAFILSIIAILLSWLSIYVNYRSEDLKHSGKLKNDLYFKLVHPIKMIFNKKYRETYNAKIEVNEFLDKHW